MVQRSASFVVAMVAVLGLAAISLPSHAQAGSSVLVYQCGVSPGIHTKSQMFGYVRKQNSGQIYQMILNCDSFVNGGQTTQSLPTVLFALPGKILSIDVLLMTIVTEANGTEVVDVVSHGTKTGHLEVKAWADPVNSQGNAFLYIDIQP